MGEKIGPPVEELEDWTPEPKDHYSNKGSHRCRHDFWAVARKLERAVIKAGPLPRTTPLPVEGTIFEAKIEKGGE